MYNNYTEPQPINQSWDQPQQKKDNTDRNIMIGGGLFVLAILGWILYSGNEKDEQKKAEKERQEQQQQQQQPQQQEQDKAEKERQDDAKKHLNIYRHNGKDVLCPPKYNFAKQVRYNKQDRDLYTSKYHNCWMTTDTDDCFTDFQGNKTCDPRKYYINDYKWPVEELGDPRGKGIVGDPLRGEGNVGDTFKGLIYNSKHADKTNELFFISAIPYDDKYLDI